MSTSHAKFAACIPGQDLILQLRTMFEESENFDGVVPILQSLLQPPDMSNVDLNRGVLFNSRMITEQGDQVASLLLGDWQAPCQLICRLVKMVTLGVILDDWRRSGCHCNRTVAAKGSISLGNPFVHKNPDELYFYLSAYVHGSDAAR